MKVLIAGGTGFIGQELSHHLKQAGYDLTLLSRHKQQYFENYHNMLTWGELTNTDANNFDAIINLCGLNIANKRWSNKIKTQLINSRVIPAKKLIDFIDTSGVRLLNASAISFYPFSTSLQSESQPIEFDKNVPFSSKIVKHWEGCLSDSRLENPTALRFGIIIGSSGGILSKMLLPTKFCVNPILGNGSQLMSWMSVKDVCRAIKFILEKPIIEKAVNFTTPNPISNKQFTQTLSKLLNRPQFLRLPESMVKLLFGDMGKELMLTSHNVQPEVLLKAGFEFNYPTIEQALKEEIG